MSVLRAIAWLLVAAMVAGGCGEGDAGAGPVPPDGDPFEEVERATPDPDAPARAAPRWEQVLTLSGEGPVTEEFPIAEDALQWRANYRCGSGELVLQVEDADEPMLEAECPDEDQAYAIETGFLELDVDASGPWELTVEQQVDTIYEEPPLEGMDEGEVLAEGSFYAIERTGEGTATLYRLPDGRLALRFADDFQTLASPDLYVWLSEAEEPTTSAEAFEADRVDIGEITTTFGDHNYVLPDDVDPERIRSIVIWCAPVQIAYAAAALNR
ncbi:MAG TPA: DM13 domain-containing protein [Egibacteraceae bacterium]|nr:DM13 domain-containing protein [Egibacteraceae bacterium]